MNFTSSFVAQSNDNIYEAKKHIQVPLNQSIFESNKH